MTAGQGSGPPLDLPIPTPMFSAITVAAVIALCPATGPVTPVADPQAPAPDALVACVGKAPITGELFSHWLVIAQKGSAPGGAKQLRLQVMDFLVSAKSLEGEAAERGIALSDRAVRRRMTRQKHQAFRTEREFRQFLKESGMTRSDVKYRVRLDMLSARLRKAAAGSGSPAAQQRKLTRFVQRFRAKWIGRTACLEDYMTVSCGSTLRTTAPPETAIQP